MNKAVDSGLMDIGWKRLSHKEHVTFVRDNTKLWLAPPPPHRSCSRAIRMQDKATIPHMLWQSQITARTYTARIGDHDRIHNDMRLQRWRHKANGCVAGVRLRPSALSPKFSAG
jgi:hypothetical protein